jgi:hypothetical protein
MGTNYIRIPKSSEMRDRHIKLMEEISDMDIWDSETIKSEFRTIETSNSEKVNPWEEFMEDVKVHLGKRSSGWKFCWNFHNGKYYTNKEELLKFIRSGKVVDEYGELMDTEEFIKMALEWGQPDGYILNKEYEMKIKEQSPGAIVWGERYYDNVIDGLRVAQTTEFS